MSELAITLIEENKKAYSKRKPSAKRLDLGRCGLLQLPEELFELEWLTELSISNECWDSKKYQIVQSVNKGPDNLIATIHPNIKKLQCLEILHISGGMSHLKMWDINDCSSLGNLTSLEILSLNKQYKNHNLRYN